MLTIFGSINIDQVIRVQSIPLPGETTLGERVMDTHGGKGANQAVAAARAGGGDVPVVMVGAVGNDAHGSTAIENLTRNSVVPEVTTLSESATGTAFVVLSCDGENAITVVSGANDSLSYEHASAATLERTSTLLCQGEVSLEETVRVMRVFRNARSEGVILLNLAPVPGKSDAATVLAALGYCDILIVNELEAEAMCGMLASEKQADMPTFSKRHNCSIIMTRGPDGAELIFPNGARRHAPSPKVDPVDTTGAGDTFCGVLAILIAEGWNSESAMLMACKAAAQVCTAVGAQASMPCRTEFLKGE